MSTPATEYQIGVIGYGISAKVFHIPFILTTTGLKLAAVVQRKPSTADDVSKDHPGVKRYDSAEGLIADPEIHAVVITSTPEVHYEHTKLALLSNKSVIVEKPFCPSFKEAQELISLAKNRNLILSVYQNRRFDTDFVLVQELIRKQSFGRVVEFETHIDYHMAKLPQDWRGKRIAGGGAIYDLGSHLLDQVVYLFGMPKSITAFIDTQRTIEGNPNQVDDYFTMLLHYNSKLTVTAKSNTTSPETHHLRFWIRGDKGTFKKYHLDMQQSQIMSQGMVPSDPQFAAEPEQNYGTLSQLQEDGSIQSSQVPTPHDVSWRTYYSLFKKALDGEGPAPVSGDIPAQVIRLIELAKKSSRTGRTLEA